MKGFLLLCAALVPVALGLWVVNLFIDGRLTMRAGTGILLALAIFVAAAGPAKDLATRIRLPRRKPREGTDE